MAGIEMSASEIADFLNRNWDARIRVLEFEAAAAVLVYDPNPPGALDITFNIPGMITSEGIKYRDDKYGEVSIVPDAQANLHYLKGSAGSLPGIPKTPSGLSAMLPSLPSVTTLVVIFALVAGAVILVDRNV